MITTVKGTTIMYQQQQIEPLHPIVDYDKCNNLMNSLEKYSKKLDSLLEKATNIETISLRIDN